MKNLHKEQSVLSYGREGVNKVTIKISANNKNKEVTAVVFPSGIVNQIERTNLRKKQA